MSDRSGRVAPAPSHYEVRLASPSDREAVEALFDECFPMNDPGLFPRHETEVSDGIAAGQILVATDQSTAGHPIVGFLQWGRPSRADVHIEGVGVTPAHRGHGLGVQLLRFAMSTAEREGPPCPDFSMTTSPNNQWMLRCAFECKFSAAELYRDYFGTGADRLYLRTAPDRSRLRSDNVTFIPIENTALMENLVERQSHALVGFADLPQGRCYRMVGLYHVDVSGPISNESGASIGVAAVLIGAFSFLFGLGLVGDGYPGSLLILVGLGFLSSVGAMLVYGKTTAEVSRIRSGSLADQIAAGNILSEIGGYYSLFHVVPVSFAQSADQRWLGMVLAVIATLGLSLYHSTDFEMLQRYAISRAARMVLEALLAVSPILGVVSLMIWDNTTWWAFGDVVLLMTVMAVMGSVRHKSRHT